LLLVCILLLAQAPQQAPPRDAKPAVTATGGTIAGRVVDADTGAPIDGAVVSIVLVQSSGRPAPVEADERGVFRVTELAAGDYRVTVSAPEHRPTHLSKVWNVDPNPTASLRASLQLKAGEARDDIVVRLDRALAIEGRVVDEFGEPMADARVTVERREGVGAFSASQPATDDRGLFRVYGLSTGVYRVCASPAFTADPGLLRGAEGEVAERPYVETCGPRVVLKAGNVPHVALTLSRVVGYSVSGRVSSESGRERLDVSVSRADGDGGRSFNASVKDGVFVVHGVPPGQYTVRATATPAAPGPSKPELATTTIQVDATDVSGVELVTAQGATVIGQIVSDSPLPAGTRMSVHRGLTHKRSSPMFSTQGVVREDGTFQLEHVYEPLVLALGGLPRGWVMTSVRYRGAEIIDTLTTFASTSEPSELQIRVSPQSARLNVRPVDADGRLVEGARVLLLGAAGDRVALMPISLAQPGIGGAVELPPVRPGEYVVIALRPEDLLPRPVDQAALVRQFGKPIVLTAGQPRTIDVAVVTLPEGR
jgi:hypothetical protein